MDKREKRVETAIYLQFVVKFFFLTGFSFFPYSPSFTILFVVKLLKSFRSTIFALPFCKILPFISRDRQQNGHTPMVRMIWSKCDSQQSYSPQWYRDKQYHIFTTIFHSHSHLQTELRNCIVVMSAAGKKYKISQVFIWKDSGTKYRQKRKAEGESTQFLNSIRLEIATYCKCRKLSQQMFKAALLRIITKEKKKGKKTENCIQFNSPTLFIWKRKKKK